MCHLHHKGMTVYRWMTEYRLNWKISLHIKMLGMLLEKTNRMVVEE